MHDLIKNVIKFSSEIKSSQELLEEMKKKNILVKAGILKRKFWLWDFDFNAIISIPAELLKRETIEEENVSYLVCTEKWGTIDIPSETSVIFDTGEITFLTEGEMPIPIIQALPQIIPHISFEWVCAEREVVRCKRYVCHNGQITSIEEPAEGSRRAYEIYIACWGIDDCMHLDTNGNWVKHNCGNCPNPCQQ